MARALVLLGMLLLVPCSIRAQPQDLDLPPSSPMWWTLTDELSPRDLRAIYRDEDGHLARYRAAVDAGLIDPLPEEHLTRLAFFYAPAQTPELVPLWFAFHVFGYAYLERQGTEETTNILAGFGLEPEAIEVILELSREEQRRFVELREKVRDDAERFVELQRRAVARRGGGPAAAKSVHQALRRDDAAFFARSSGLPEDRIRELMTAWRTSPAGEASSEVLVDLRAQLSNESWNRLRRYLLEIVAARMGTFTDLDPEGVR